MRTMQLVPSARPGGLIITLVTILILAGAPPAVLSDTRTWEVSPILVPPCDGRSDAELGCEIVVCEGFGAAGVWATEVQTAFRLPDPPLGGPWLVEYVALFLSGCEPRRLIVRAVDAPGEQPGMILGESREFVPAYGSWPPGEWTFVELRPEAPYPEHLQGFGAGLIMVGTGLAPGDALGLVTAGVSGHPWGLHDGVWYEDSEVAPAIRLGISDLGLSESQRATWGRVKGLFK